MKKIMKRSDSNSGITPKSLSVAFLLSLAIIGAGCEQSQAADLNTNISPAEREKFVSEGSELTNLREGTLTETGEGSIPIDAQIVNQVKKSLSSGKKSNKFFKSLSDKVSNDTTLQHTERGLATGAAAEYTPILDNLYESGDSTVQSAYQFTETTATSGNNVFKIGDKYYQLTYKDSFYEQFTNPTLDRAYEAGESPIDSAYTLTETTATSGTNVYKIGDKYYQFAIKDGVTSGGRITTNQNGNPVTTHIFGSVVNNSNGAAINNPKNGIIGNVTGDFANNQAKNTYAYGGAIANRTANCSIGDILGDFIGNSVYGTSYQMGGAIHSTKIIGDITGNFINNGSARRSTYGYGGAIYIEYGTAGNITGNFIGNHIDATYGYGGAIATDNNAGTIGDITGVFIGNRASGEGSRGGAIFNEGTMGNITGDFIENYSRGDAGAIYNYSGFMGNVNADFINNTATYSGGAIYNRAGTIGDVSGNFISNHAVTHGGAISTKADITLLADNTNNIISGNWIGTEDNKQYEAIYVENTTANLSIEATNGGVWTIYDYINGVTGYNLTLTGDNTGVVDYNNDLYGSPNLTIENVTLDVSDGETNTYNLTSLTSTDGQISVDVNYDMQTADKLVTTGEATGTVYISGLNFTGTKTTGDTYQILDIASGDAQLAFGDNIKIIENGEETEFHEGFIFTPSMVDSTVQYGDIYASTEGLMLATTNTTNDSITINPEEIFDQILTYLNQKETTDERNFNFVTSGNVYTVTLPVGTTTAGTLNINGVSADNGAKSTIDFNNTDGFNLANDTTLNIENTKITNAVNSAIRVTNEDAEVNLTNVDFDGNTSTSGGSAIYNKATIGDVSGNFINNSTTATNAYGGAIGNIGVAASIGDITGDFTGNSGFFGGAIYNSGTIGDLTGNYSGNSAKYGGVIRNEGGTIGDIAGNFTDNQATSSNSNVGGGAITNSRNGASIGNIVGDFTNNSTFSSAGYVQAGGIYNENSIGDITGNFTNNSATSTYSIAYGGAIRNYVYTTDTYASIGDITGDFTGNSATGKTATYGGAISNQATKADSSSIINGIEGNFSNNTVTSTDAAANGGAIHNAASSGGIASIGDIAGDFTGNTAFAKTTANGGAIYNNGATAQFGDIEGNFSGNTATSETTTAYGGAIYNANGTLGALTGDFTSNSTTAASSTEGGALYNTGTIGDITGNFLSNSISGGKNGNGGAIRNAGTIGKITGNFINTSAVAGEFSHGGAICNTSSIDQISGNFIDNYAKSTSDTYLALGGAIYHSGDENTLNIVADGKYVVFDGNYTEDYRGKINNAIFVVTNRAIAVKDDNNVIIGYEYENSTPKLTLNATNDGRFILNDNIDGGGFIFDDVYDGTHHGTHLERNHQYDLDITGDETGVVNINNDILNANITHENVTTNVSDWSYLSHTAGEGINSLTMNSGVMNIPYLTTEPVTLSSFNMNGGTINLDRVDVDLEGIKMGRFIADDYSGGAGTINVNSLNLLNATDRLRTEILFADTSFANTVRYNGEKVIAASPIYIYDVAYENLSDGGYFSFTRKNNEFNPAVLVSPVATQIAGQATMNQAFQYVFEHADAFTQMPAIDRFARIHSNEYALSTDFNNNLGTLNALSMNKGVWVRPYTSFDKTDLKNGPEVKSINYGTIIGADTEFRKMKNGWTNVGTGYIGYFGSQVDFKGVDTSMNGGLLGLTETFYKGNFFTALTASAGGGFAESHTMYGKEDLTTLMAGVASKTGYNFEFKEGKFIVQPILKMDYTMINTFDYTNAAGVKVDNKPMHTIQINPSVRFIGNLKGGWQPYASVGMVWNLMNETDVRANGVELPGMHTKPYIEYGVGIQRYWNERFTAFGQAMVRNGGRTGVALTAGFRWALGKDEPKDENEKNVKREEPVKVIKGERSHSTGAAVTTEPVVVKQTPAINTERVLYNSNALTKEEIAARTANLSKYNALIK